MLKAHGDVRLPGALSRCSSLSSVNTSSGIDIESPTDTASLSTHHFIRRFVLLSSLSSLLGSDFIFQRDCWSAVFHWMSKHWRRL